MNQVVRWLVIAAIVGLVVGNAWVCRRHCASEASLRNNQPFLTDDHPLHYANALSTRTYLRESATNAGYDPFFMAGYAKSSIWPTNALLELVMLATPTVDSPIVFKTFVWSSSAAIPLAIIYAGIRLGASMGVVCTAIVIWLMQFWAGVPFYTYQYIQFGMCAFVWSVALTLAAGAAFDRWRRCGTLPSTIELGIVAGVALMAHPTVAVLLGAPCVVAIALVRNRPRGLLFRQASIAASIVVAMNYWWIVPLVTLHGSFAGAPGFFKNPNVLERLADLFRPDQSVPLLIGPPVMGVALFLAAMNRMRLGIVVPLTIAWIFLLAFPAGLFERLSFLQVGRNTIHLSAWICLPAAWFLSIVWKSWKGFPRAAVLLVVGWCAACGVVDPFDHVVNVTTHEIHMTSAEMFAKHRVILDEIRRESADSRRVLFELFEDRISEMAGASNPYGSVRLSPLIPFETGLEVIGGPYWATHYRTNFTNCGEGYFVGGKRWERRLAEEYFQIYAIDVAVLWSRPALGFAETNPDLLELAKDLHGVKVYRVRRRKAPWEEAGLKIAATYNKIDVTNPREAKGTFVLPYHATRGWTASPSCKFVSMMQAEDPVPFLTLVDPPEKVTLRFSPWTLSGPPPSE